MTKEELKKLIEPIKIVKVVSKVKHENADRLFIVKVDDGSGEEKQIVTAANNFEEGDLVPHLAPGNVVPGWLITNGEEIKLEERAMRGEMSFGMILAEDEIGVGNDHEGIMIVNKKNSKFAMPEGSQEIRNKEELVGKSILEVLKEDVIDSVLEETKILAGLEAVTDEIIGKEDLIKLVKNKARINHYIGFEISGLVHLGTGLMAGLVIRELQKLGVQTKIFMADWHTWINNKLGGDQELISKVASEYFAPALLHSIDIAGGDSSKVEIVTGSDLYHDNDDYWKSVIEVSKNLTLSRVLKSTTILGRESSNSMEFAMLIYPSMQAADIFHMENHIAHAGTDQRNVHVIAREVAEKLNVKPLINPIDNSKMKPISIHHSLVSGLQKPAQWPLPEDIDKKALMTTLKMSKSVKGSAIFITDTEEEIREKIKKAFCPEEEIGYNPVLNWVKMMIFPIIGTFELKRDEKFGGNMTFKTFEELEKAYESGDVFPLDLKNNVADILVELLKPAREFFSTPERQELISKIIDARSR